MKLNNLTITPKLGILVGVTLLGLCAAGVLAGYLMQREMLNARIDQTHAIVEMARNMAIGLQKQVDAGQMTKEAALAEFGQPAWDRAPATCSLRRLTASPCWRPIPSRLAKTAWTW